MIARCLLFVDFIVHSMQRRWRWPSCLIRVGTLCYRSLIGTFLKKDEHNQRLKSFSMACSEKHDHSRLFDSKVLLECFLIHFHPFADDVDLVDVRDRRHVVENVWCHYYQEDLPRLMVIAKRLLPDTVRRRLLDTNENSSGQSFDQWRRHLLLRLYWLFWTHSSILDRSVDVHRHYPVAAVLHRHQHERNQATPEHRPSYWALLACEHWVFEPSSSVSRLSSRTKTIVEGWIRLSTYNDRKDI